MNQPPQNPKEKLIADVKVVVGDAGELLRERAREKISSTRENFAGSEGMIKERSQVLLESANRFVHENPWMAVGIAAGLSLLLGILLGQR